jgi:hypothetical protein
MRLGLDRVQYGSKSSLITAKLQVRGVERRDCKSVGSAYPGSNPGPATQRIQPLTSPNTVRGCFVS